MTSVTRRGARVPTSRRSRARASSIRRTVRRRCCRTATSSLAASAGLFNTPAHFVEFDGTNLTEVAAPADSIYDSSYNINFLLLPTGEVMETDFSGDIELYTQADTGPSCHDHGSPPPELDSLPSTLVRGQTYTFSGEQLHGISAGISYGDDAQAATDYPIVQITNRATGHVQYGRTHGFSNFSIARGAHSSALLDIPATLETGTSELVVIANGIASEPDARADQVAQKMSSPVDGVAPPAAGGRARAAGARAPRRARRPRGPRRSATTTGGRAASISSLRPERRSAFTNACSITSHATSGKSFANLTARSRSPVILALRSVSCLMSTPR